MRRPARRDTGWPSCPAGHAARCRPRQTVHGPSARHSICRDSLQLSMELGRCRNLASLEIALCAELYSKDFRVNKSFALMCEISETRVRGEERVRGRASARRPGAATRGRPTPPPTTASHSSQQVQVAGTPPPARIESRAHVRQDTLRLLDVCRTTR